MFFHVKLTKQLKLHPRYFRNGVSAILRDRLVDEVEGTCTGRYGFIINVVRIEDVGPGMLDTTDGVAVYNIRYMAIVFRPFKGEVLDAIVTSVSERGLFAEAGPLQIFVSARAFPNNLQYNPESNPPSYISTDSNDMEVLAKDSAVRVKIVGTRNAATEIFAVGSIREDYLGLIG
mmetsp:Transcript_26423/g.73831  ORF Transcript_26423/g.73831 Transcript_26423/m.73831 type:complete len:175 (-) Transcript_26423:1269-1793(-)